MFFKIGSISVGAAKIIGCAIQRIEEKDWWWRGHAKCRTWIICASVVLHCGKRDVGEMVEVFFLQFWCLWRHCCWQHWQKNSMVNLVAGLDCGFWWLVAAVVEASTS